MDLQSCTDSLCRYFCIQGQDYSIANEQKNINRLQRGKKIKIKMDVKGAELSGEGSLLLRRFVSAKSGAWQVTLKCHISVSQKCLRNVRTLEQLPGFFRLCPDLCPQTAASDPTTTTTKTMRARVVKLSHKSHYCKAVLIHIRPYWVIHQEDKL